MRSENQDEADIRKQVSVILHSCFISSLLTALF